MINGLLGDYCDGELFKNNQLFKDDPTALQIQLYYDELEVCNPLGTKAKKHKLGKNYMSMHTAFKIFLQVCCIIHLGM